MNDDPLYAVMSRAMYAELQELWRKDDPLYDVRKSFDEVFPNIVVMPEKIPLA